MVGHGVMIPVGIRVDSGLFQYINQRPSEVFQGKIKFGTMDIARTPNFGCEFRPLRKKHAVPVNRFRFDGETERFISIE